MANAGHGKDGTPDVLEGNAVDDLLKPENGVSNDDLKGGAGKDRCIFDIDERYSE